MPRISVAVIGVSDGLGTSFSAGIMSRSRLPLSISCGPSIGATDPDDRVSTVSGFVSESTMRERGNLSDRLIPWPSVVSQQRDHFCETGGAKNLRRCTSRSIRDVWYSRRSEPKLDAAGVDPKRYSRSTRSNSA